MRSGSDINMFYGYAVAKVTDATRSEISMTSCEQGTAVCVIVKA